MVFTTAVATHFFLRGQFRGLMGSFSQSSSKIEEVSSTLPAAELRLLLIESAFSPSVMEVATEGTVVSTVIDIIPNGSRIYPQLAQLALYKASRYVTSEGSRDASYYYALPISKVYI